MTVTTGPQNLGGELSDYDYGCRNWAESHG